MVPNANTHYLRINVLTFSSEGEGDEGFGSVERSSDLYSSKALQGDAGAD